MTMETIDQHVRWLTERNAICAMQNALAPIADDTMDAMTRIASTIEDRIVLVPATTIAGFAAKLMLLVQQNNEGCEINADWREAAISEGQAWFGSGVDVNHGVRA